MIINLTPHFVKIGGVGFVPAGIVPRVQQDDTIIGEHDGIELRQAKYGAVENLPEPKPGTIYIVSNIVRQAMPDRQDLFSPGGLVRDKQGRVSGASYLIGNGELK